MELYETLRRAVEILVFLAENQDRQYNIYQLSQELDMRRNTLTNNIKALEKLGLVETEMLRNIVPPQKIVRITEKGACLVKCIKT